ncbi:MAG: sulfatase [Candidatus Brocadiia bacterium]
MHPPNLLLVFADQMRGHDMACAGNDQVSTPNLDRMAGEGVNFANAIANNPVCTPSRGSLLTGLYPLSHRAVTNDLPIRTDVPTLGTVLRDAGYRTGYIGKWHLGGVPRDRFIPPGPERLGFDDFWAVWNCHHQYFDGKYHLDTNEVQHFEGYEPDGQTDLATQFIESHRDEPFALVVSFGPPHAPYDQVPERYLSMYDADEIRLRPNVPADSAEDRDRWKLTMARYYAAITALDECMGRMLATLERLGLDEDTLVVFTSDHGDMLGSHERRKKEQPWEEAIRVPLLMRCPRLLASGRECDAVTGITDLTPTMLGLLGANVPESMEGLDLAPLVRGEEAEVPKSVPIGIPIPVDQAVDQAVDEWRGVRTDRYTYARWSDGSGWVLYDNREDPFQQTNLIDDPDAREVRAELEAELQRWLERTNDPFPPWPELVRELDLVETWNARERHMHPNSPNLVV